jgi:cell division protein FtsL
MPFFTFDRVPRRVIMVQLLVLLGIVACYLIYLPHRTRQLARDTAATREEKINALFQDAVVEDSQHEIAVPWEGRIVKRHPQRLRMVFSPRDAVAELGTPNANTLDFAGGQHLTWLGTAHKLAGSFHAGRLYCLSLEDRATGHGELVYESYSSWHPY